MDGSFPGPSGLALDDELPLAPPDLTQPPSGGTFRLPPGGLVFEELERDLLKQALERTGGNQTRAAKLLGMTRDQIRYRIRKFDLAPVARGRD